MLKNKIASIINESQGNVAVVVKNLSTGLKISFNPDLIFPSASTIKLVILSDLLRQCKSGKFNIEDKIKITEELLTGGDGILKELDMGHTFSLKELATLMIIISDNMATNILIDLLGMDNINNTAIQLGLKQTTLQRKMMDLNAQALGKDNFTCANDMAHILELIYTGKVIDNESSKIMFDILLRQQVNGRLNLYLPEEVKIAHKTGDLDNLEHDVGIVYLPTTNYIICVLTNNLESNKEGREIIGSISKVVYDEFC